MMTWKDHAGSATPARLRPAGTRRERRHLAGRGTPVPCLRPGGTEVRSPGFQPRALASLVLAWLMTAVPAALMTAVPAARAEKLHGLPGVAAADDLELAEDRVFKLDGVELEDATIYFSPYEVFHLVIARELDSPIMISPRGRSVQEVDADKLTTTDEITAQLAAGAAARDLGRYREHLGAYTFELDGKEARLEPRPPMLGRQSLESMRDRHRRYEHKAKSYRLKRADLKSRPIRRGDVLVRVFFRSDSPICERVVPRVMRLEEELRGPDKKIRFEYHGVPARIPDDPVAAAEGIHGVPAAIVYVDGVEVGRLRALELDSPEENLFRLLSP